MWKKQTVFSYYQGACGNLKFEVHILIIVRYLVYFFSVYIGGTEQFVQVWPRVKINFFTSYRFMKWRKIVIKK